MRENEVNERRITVYIGAINLLVSLARETRRENERIAGEKRLNITKHLIHENSDGKKKKVGQWDILYQRNDNNDDDVDDVGLLLNPFVCMRTRASADYLLYSTVCALIHIVYARSRSFARFTALNTLKSCNLP